MDKFSVFFGLKLAFIVSATEQVSVALQSRVTTIQNAVDCFKLANNFLVRQRSED